MDKMDFGIIAKGAEDGEEGNEIMNLGCFN
jgi:hypothetical protein